MSDSEVVKQMRPLVLQSQSIKGEKLDVFGTSKPTEAGPDGWIRTDLVWGSAVVHIRRIAWECFLSEKKKQIRTRWASY